MKLMVIPLFCTVILLTCCKKTLLSLPDVRGGWVWVSTSNGGAPGPLNPLTPANSGMIQSISFTDTNWYLSKNSVYISSGTYTTSLVPNNEGKTVNRINFHHLNSHADSVLYFNISNDTLILSYDYTGSVGSGATVYIRATL